MYGSCEDWQRLKEESPVRIQWDPERDIKLNRLEYGSIQIGLSGEAVERYVAEWTCRIEDITCMVTDISLADKSGILMLPKERQYPLPDSLTAKIGITGQVGCEL